MFQVSHHGTRNTPGGLFQSQVVSVFGGTLWCSNSCADIYANRDLTLDNPKQVLHMIQTTMLLRLPYCKPCDDGKFLSQYKALDVLTYHKHDLAAMLYDQTMINELVKIQGRLQRFKWSLCRTCPTGLAPGAWVMPEDVHSMSGDGAETGRFSAGDSVQAVQRAQWRAAGGCGLQDRRSEVPAMSQSDAKILFLCDDDDDVFYFLGKIFCLL
jgi:hypothetical protein